MLPSPTMAVIIVVGTVLLVGFLLWRWSRRRAAQGALLPTSIVPAAQAPAEDPELQLVTIEEIFSNNLVIGTKVKFKFPTCQNRKQLFQVSWSGYPGNMSFDSRLRGSRSQIIPEALFERARLRAIEETRAYLSI